jgi:hypothetical protein
LGVYDEAMKHLPTDLQILDAIYDRYYDTFVEFTKQNQNRATKIYVPVDLAAIAKDLKVDGDIVFGRLYYHLENKYGYQSDERTRVHFFTLNVLLEGRNDHHCVNFPLLASVLADLRDSSRKQRLATYLSVISLVIAVISLGLSVVRLHQPANSSASGTTNPSNDLKVLWSCSAFGSAGGLGNSACRSHARTDH